MKIYRRRPPRILQIARWSTRPARGITRMLSRSAVGRLCGARRSAQERTLSAVRWNSYSAYKSSLEARFWSSRSDWMELMLSQY